MNETDRQAAVTKYLEEITEQFYSGHAREHSYRPALERLMMRFEKVHAVNEPKHSEHGAPDFVFLSNDNKDLILGYAEAKDINVSLDKTEKTEQMSRYGGYANLFLTDYLEFRFFRNGEKYETISLGHVQGDKLYKTPENGERLMRELEAFLEQTPEKLRSGKRLAQIMGGKSRRIRDNVEIYLTKNDERNAELTKIYEMMKKMLVHDLSEEKFADMYAQTLVYGLFVARYGDKTPDTFNRSEARDLVPKSNPFLRHFFDHIVGPDFDTRLGYIVDELCEIFLVSNVNEIVHKHLRIADDTTGAKDPIIHFYEDFLQEYDPAERKKMGAYYTPIPVVQFIVRQVDRILKEDFGITKGLASDETFTKKVDLGQTLHVRNQQTGRMQKTNLVDKTFHRVQILDPAVGTATFLNETIKYVHKSFIGQEGRWASYVNDNLLKRLYGFELMMAPYTIAHLKLGMTLQETGVDKLNERLSVFLTNTLEEGIPQQSSLFDFGLAGAVSEESRLAAEVKSEKPVMVVMGNPPYSVSSNNKSKFIENLVADYKKDLNERNIQPLSDDYIKFIRFAEDMVAKNGEGIVAMITNNSYLDGIIHRRMREHLLKTFDKLYVLDLHGNSKKKETAPDGSKDENVFDIQQGVAIILAIKTVEKDAEIAEVNYAEVYGSRNSKFSALKRNEIEFKRISLNKTNFFFNDKQYEDAEYFSYVNLNNLFIIKSSGLQTKRDKLFIDFERGILARRIRQLLEEPLTEHFKDEYKVEDSSSYRMMSAIRSSHYDEKKIEKIIYRPFDERTIYYDPALLGRAFDKTMNHMLKENVGLLASRMTKNNDVTHFYITETVSEMKTAESSTQSFHFPLYLYQNDSIRIPNFNPTELAALTRQLVNEPSPEDILDYIYAVLHSPGYRKKYKEFLKIDFPRVPMPSQGEFDRLTPLGRELRELHLMKSPLLDSYETTYPEQGNDIVESIKYNDSKVWINDTQYFGNVPEIAWNFYIGGYQPAQKWLKDRKGRKLSNTDLDHYQKIIKILIETDKIMKQIG